ncbi:hypothetical protein HELRODRAFT_156457 [Helobdella robusta]|uniref:UMP-CMP kinase n=1 Tax=Helobdella robusta TaxID=6412 RepID=T1ELX0_HELRO|nr:hypothetical protein HELRODRAFT_156457 [Helobdella robusta]ESO09419.1 hypothetical protein HELRODRAFT_156457 [Helobdella robusta]
MTNLPKVIFVLGLPGSGKGTQCQKIVQEFGCVHLSAGELLRIERSKPGSQFGEMIEKHIKEGTIVPVEVTCSLLEQSMKKEMEADKAKDTFLIDGFPRNKNNMDGWQKEMSHKTDLQFVLIFECTEKECVERCLSRGEAGSGRTDDNIESLQKRQLIRTHISSTEPIIEFYEAKGLVRKVNGSRSPDEVFEDVRKIFVGLKKK